MGHSSSYLNKHSDYVDRRIALLHDYVGSEDDPDLIRCIISFIINPQVESKAIKFSINNKAFFALQDIAQLFKEWNIFQDGDLLGYIYQGIQPKKSKNSKGQYFTPAPIVNLLVRKSWALLNPEVAATVKILDPACGSGLFLISLYKLLFTKLTEQNDHISIPAQIISQLFGIDLDPIAVLIARTNLSKMSGIAADKINIYNTDFLLKEDLFSNHSAILNNVKFDIIVGNPPWGSSLTSEQKKYFKSHYHTTASGVNTFALFIERSFEFLKTNGVLAILIPEAYLNIKVHSDSRRFILDHAIISDIFLWGEQFKSVYAPCITLILQNCNNPKERATNIIRIVPQDQTTTNTCIIVPQASFHTTPENIFNINYSRKAIKLLSDIVEHNDCFYLKNNARFFLGIVTGNNDHFISKKFTEAHQDPIIIGRDLSQYKVNFSGHYFNSDSVELQQVAPKHLYLAKDKVLYRFIGKQLTFAIDSEGYYSLNNVNGFIPNDITLSNEALVSLLNSWIIQYYYQNSFFTIKVLKSNLERLPLKWITPVNQKKIARLSMDIINQSGNANGARETIEDIIFHTYGINDRHAYSIYESVINPLHSQIWQLPASGKQ